MRPITAVVALPWLLLVAIVAAATPATAAAQEPRPASEDPGETGDDGTEEPLEARSTRVSCLEEGEQGLERKGVQKRDFLKRHRFELAALGGFFASDALSSTYTYGGALAYFPSEDFGLEAIVTRSRVEFRLEQPFGDFDQRRRFAGGPAMQAMLGLLFSPIHAKFKWNENAIVHGDIFVVAGAGRTFHDTVQGYSWQAGLGLKLHLASFLSFRIDLRDFVLPQEVLGRGQITHNVAVIGGLSVWLL